MKCASTQEREWQQARNAAVRVPFRYIKDRGKSLTELACIESRPPCKW